MKIIVSSVAEQELMKRFIEFFNDIDGSELVEDIDHEDLENLIIESDEYQFIRDGFNCCKIEVGDTNRMETEHYIVTGTCSKCGEQTEGTEDGHYVGYDDYLTYMSLESQTAWLCSQCIDRERKEEYKKWLEIEKKEGRKEE